MKRTRWFFSLSLVACLALPTLAEAWQLRGGGGGRSFVVPHQMGGGSFQRPTRPPGHPPQPMPRPQPAPHPMPGPHPGPGPGPAPGPHPYPGPGPMPPPPPPPPPPPHHDDWYHPWAAAAVVGATTAAAIAVGTEVVSIPPDCVSVVANGVAYQHCGTTWYQPRYVANGVSFIVVPAPW